MIASSSIISTTCQSQTTISNDALRKAAKLIEAGKACSEKVTLYEQLVESLNARIALKDSIIASYVVKDTATARVVATWTAERDNLVVQRDIAVKTMEQQNKLMRRQKRKTVFVAIFGPVLTAAGFIYFKK